VVNPKFEEDVNIYSVHLALDVSKPTLIFESDIYFSDSAMQKLMSACFAEDSVWFTRGPLEATQSGGILASQEQKITDIRIIPNFSPQWQGYKKLIGVLKIGSNEVSSYAGALNQAMEKGIRQYYLTPWIENLATLPCRECDLAPEIAFSFNTPDDYKRIRSQLEGRDPFKP